MIQVTLSWPEVYVAATVGLKRQLGAMRDNRPDSHGFDGKDGFKIHIDGACGEMAFCKALNRYNPATVDTYKQGADVGERIQIRTRSDPRYDLIVRHDDRDDDIFALVIGKIPTYQIIGWISGKDAKQTKWLKSFDKRPKAYFVPKEALSKEINLLP